jgi:hypothetical protein
MPEDDNNKLSNKLSHSKQTTSKHHPHLMYVLVEISTKNQAPKWLKQQSNTEHPTAKNYTRKCHNIANIKDKAENKMRARPRPPKPTLFRLLTLYGLIVGQIGLRHPSDDLGGLAEPPSMAVAKTQKYEGQ